MSCQTGTALKTSQYGSVNGLSWGRQELLAFAKPRQLRDESKCSKTPNYLGTSNFVTTLHLLPRTEQGWSPAPAVRALLEQREFPGNTLKEPNNHSRKFKTGKKSKMSPISHLAGTTHLRGYTLQLPVVFPSITIDLLNRFAGNILTVQPLESSKKGLLVTALLCFENNADAQYCFSLNSS